MTSMTKPTPDGHVSITWHDLTRERKIYPFSKIRRYKPQGAYLFIHCLPEQRRYVYIPWTSILELEIITNTPAYLEAIDQWAREDHPNHRELDLDCPMCVEIDYSNTMARMANQVIYVQPTDGEDN